MGRKVRHHAALLEYMFSRPEWEYLKRHPKFKKEMESICDSLEHIEKLGAVGDRLLAEWENKNPHRAKFERASRGVRLRKPNSKGASGK